jgi:hypothetical protein
MEVTGTFVALLGEFRWVFTAPTFNTFVLLMSGWILSVRHRYVTDLIISSDSVGNGHFSDYHRFFSHAAWDIDDLWKLLLQLLLRVVVGEGRILLAGDDTLCRKRGLNLFGVGMHHDPLISSRAMKLVSWGHDWVILYLLVVCPWWAPTKVFALPIGARLYRNRQGVTKGQKKQPQQSRAASAAKPRVSSGTRQKKATKKQMKKARQAARRRRRKVARATPRSHKNPAKASPVAHRTRPELLLEMLQLVAGWFPERKFLLVVDSLYSGRSVLSHLPSNMDLIGPVHPKAALYAPPPPRSGRGAPRKKGDRLPDRDAWAQDGSRWQTLDFDQFGLHTRLRIKSREGLYYKAGKSRLLKFVLTRDAAGQRPTQIYYCTDLQLTEREVLSSYACRWSVEVTHQYAKQLLGLDDPANRTELAVQRTAPMALFLYSLIVTWHAQHGYRHLRFPERPWYRRKTEVSFGDMLTTLRRVTWENQLGVTRVPRVLAH